MEKKTISRRIVLNAFLVVLFVVSAAFIWYSRDYLDMNPWDSYNYGYEATRIDVGDDGNIYARPSSAQELLKINLNNEIERLVNFTDLPLNAFIEQFAIDKDGNIYTVEIYPAGREDDKTGYGIKKYTNDGALLATIAEFDNKTEAANSLNVSPINFLQFKNGVLYFGEQTDKAIIISKYDTSGLQPVLTVPLTARQLNDIEDLQYLPETAMLIVARRNGQMSYRAANGSETVANGGWPGEVNWNLEGDGHGGLYYADLDSNRVYNINPQVSGRRVALDLNSQAALVDMDWSDEILRNFNVGGTGALCVNGRKNILLIAPDGTMKTLPAVARIANDFKFFLIAVWLAALVGLLIVLYFATKLLHFVVRYPTELAKVMFYLFIIAAAGVMAAKLANDNIMRDYEKTLTKENQQLAVIAARVFDAEALKAINGKIDYNKPEYKLLQQDADDIFRPAGDKNQSIDRGFVLYKPVDGKMRLVVSNHWRSLWQPLPRNESTEGYYQLAEKATVESWTEQFGKKAYIVSYAPVLDTADKVIGSVEVRYDLSNVHNELRLQFWRDLVGIIFLLVTFHLIIVELNQLLGAWKRSREIGQPLSDNLSIVRLLSFLTYMAVSMSLLYCASRIGQFDQTGLAIPKELVMALPFAVEMLSVVTLNLFLAGYMDRWGWKPQMIVGVVLMIIGCIMTWGAVSLPLFLLGRVFNGAAFAVQVNALKAFVVCEQDPHQRKIGSAERTTGRFAGGLCGITIGTLVATYSTLQATFLCSAVIAVILLLAVCLLTKNSRFEATEHDKVSTIQAFFIVLKEPRMLFYLALVFFPLYFLDGFNSYMVPVVVKNLQLDSDYIGYASFIVFLCCSYFSKPLALNLSRRLPLYGCILIGMGLYLTATVVLLLTGTLGGIILASVIFGLGISINGGLITEMFLHSYVTKQMGNNNMNNVCGILFALKGGLGPVLLGVCWKFGAGNGILMYCAGAVVLAAIYLSVFRKGITR